MKIILLDGNNLFLRFYFKVRADFGGAYGFSRMYSSIVRDDKPYTNMYELEVKDDNYFCIVAWDKGKSKRRMELYPEYKANRPMRDDYEDILFEMEMCKEFVKGIGGGINIAIDNFEADDIIAVLANKIAEKSEVCIVSTDKDFHQLLVNKNISIYNPIKKVMIKRDEIAVFPEYWTTYAALKGDPSDNIKGILNIGKKRAKEIVDLIGNDIHKIRKTKWEKYFSVVEIIDVDKNITWSMYDEFYKNKEMIDFNFITKEEKKVIFKEFIRKMKKKKDFNTSNYIKTCMKMGFKSLI